MMEVFEATENTISKEKRRNKVLQKQSDRLLEFVLNADILSVIMNDVYESGTSALVDDHKTENALLKGEIEKLKYENEALSKHSDDMQSLLSKEICQLKHKLE